MSDKDITDQWNELPLPIRRLSIHVDNAGRINDLIITKNTLRRNHQRIISEINEKIACLQRDNIELAKEIEADE